MKSFSRSLALALGTLWIAAAPVVAQIAPHGSGHNKSASVPEPATYLGTALALGIGVLFVTYFKRRRKSA